MQPRISFITLAVADLERAVRFYRDGLGLPQRPGEGQIAFFETHATWLALYPRELLAADPGVPAAGSGFAGFTLAHNVGSQEQVNSLLSTALAAGATLVKPAVETDWGGYSGYFSDPDGHLWEVAWNPHFPLA